MALNTTWEPSTLQVIHSGPDSVKEHLLPTLKKLISDGNSPKALIITGNSLATKTSIIKDIEKLLGDAHVGTFTKIGEHAPIANIKSGIEEVKRSGANVLVGIGGGSPIDAAKVISKINHDDNSVPYLPVLAIPTTLSAAELTSFGGYTDENTQKQVIQHPEINAKAIIYDAKLSLDTPEKLWLSTGMRALDHAIESQYRKDVQWQIKKIAVLAAKELEENLRKCKRDPKDIDTRTKLQLASALSLWPNKLTTPLGLSHALGYALGPPFGIPHGMCTCLVLPGVSKLPVYRPFIESSVDVGKLTADLGLSAKLSEYKVPREKLREIAEGTLTKLNKGGISPLPNVDELVKILEDAY